MNAWHRLRWGLGLVAAVLLGFALELRAQGSDGITVTVTPPSLSLRPNQPQQAEVRVVIDVPTTAGPPMGARASPGEAGDPRFSAGGFTGGKLSLESSSGVQFDNGSTTSFTILRSPGATRVHAELRYLFVTDASAVPGEMVFGVEGGQGMHFLGVREQGLPTFRGEGHLVLVGQAGSRPAQGPPARPRSNPTDQSINPTQEIINRITPIVALLGPIALVNWLSTRPRKRRDEPKPEPKDKPEPPPLQNEDPPRRTSTKDDDKKAKNLQLAVLCPNALEFNGDGKQQVSLNVRLIVPPDTDARLVGSIQWQAMVTPRPPPADGKIALPPTKAQPERYQRLLKDPDGESDTEQVWNLTAPWEWSDVDVVFTASATAKASGKRTPVKLTASSQPLRFIGAKPELRMTSSPELVPATGRDKCELRLVELKLFGLSCDQEKVRAMTVALKAEQTGADSTYGKPDPQYSNAAWSHLIQENDTNYWVPPFLVQESGYGEFLELDVRCEWTGGPMFDQAIAGGATQPFPLLPAQCDVTLLGCTLESTLEKKTLLPVAGTPLKGKAQLIGSGRKGVVDPFGQDSIHAEGARITCRVRDLSQGRPTRPGPHFCTLPPKHPCDVGLDPALATGASFQALREKKLQEILATTGQDVATPALRVGPGGYLVSGDAGDAPEPLAHFWDYTPRQGEDPIHDGPVVLTIKVEDGLGGTIEVRDSWAVQLASLVLETGGLDFHVYEHRPFLFDVQCDAALPDTVQDVTFHWEFALVDRQGNPRHAAGTCETKPVLPLQPQNVRSDLVVGHMPSGREILIRTAGQSGLLGGGDDRTTGEVESFRNGPAAAAEIAKRRSEGWRQIENAERDRSVALRHQWHVLWSGLSEPRRQIVSEDEQALPWLAEKDKTNWRDDALFFAVRLELRDAQRNLLGTSDRLAPWGLAASSGGVAGGGSRTPPEFVWRDHMFRFVLLKLRLRLEDLSGQRYNNRDYRLEFPSGPAVSGLTADDGHIELALPPRSESEEVSEAKLVFLSPKCDPTGMELSLKLGDLDPVDRESGVQGRLNNLGLFASESVIDDLNAATAEQKDRYHRAIHRFQSLRRLGPTKKLHEEDARELAEVHDEIGIVHCEPGSFPPERKGAGLVTQPAKAAGTPVARQRTGPPAWENPFDPAPSEKLRQREACVGLGHPNTLRLPGDLPRPEKEIARWFDETAGMKPARKGNRVRYLLDGPETYNEIATVMRQADGPEDFIYMLGWCLYPNFTMVPGDDSAKIMTIFKEAAGEVQIGRLFIDKAKNAAEQAEKAAKRAGAARTDDVAEATLQAVAAAEEAGRIVARAQIDAALRRADDARDVANKAADDARRRRQAAQQAWQPGDNADAEAAEAAARDAAWNVATVAAQMAAQLAPAPNDETGMRHAAEAREAAQAAEISAKAGDTMGVRIEAEKVAGAAGYFAVAPAVQAAREATKTMQQNFGAHTEQRNLLAAQAAQAGADAANSAFAAAETVADLGARMQAHAAVANAQNAANRAKSSLADPGAADAAKAATLAMNAANSLEVALRVLNQDSIEPAAARFLPDDPRINLLQFVEQLAENIRLAANQAEQTAAHEDAKQAVRHARETADAVAGSVTKTLGKRVQVRGIFWQYTTASYPILNLIVPTGYQSEHGAQYDELMWISRLTDGYVVQENKTESATGTHHQKVIIVRHGGELTAFCGGLDINPDRVYAIEPGSPNEKGDTQGAPFHDAHCRIEGPAAYDLLQTFIDRWSYLLAIGYVNDSKGPLRGGRVSLPAERPDGRAMVQVGRTFGVPSIAGMILPKIKWDPSYGFAPQGERTAWRIIRHAIHRAQRFIYLEDQYLTSRDASEAILEALRLRPTIEHVTILIPCDEHADMHGWQGTLRQRFLRPLLNEFPEKVRVFILNQPAVPASSGSPARPEDWHTYVHNKMWIIDDQFAVIGSANCNVRSYTNDSECVVGILDPSTDERCSYSLVHQLRVAVWAEHLNMNSAEGYAELADGVASAMHWLRPPEGARIAEYQVYYGQDPFFKILDNEAQAEPRGSGQVPVEEINQWR